MAARGVYYGADDIQQQLGLEKLSNILCDSTYFKFSVIRDTYSRVLSAFRDKIWCKGEGGSPSITFQEFLFTYLGPRLNMKSDRYRLWSLNEHFYPQHLFCAFDQVPWDLVLRMEYLNSSLQNFTLLPLLRELKKRSPLFPTHVTTVPAAHNTTGGKTAYLLQSSFTAEMLDLLDEFYAIDNAYFGFSRNKNIGKLRPLSEFDDYGNC